MHQVGLLARFPFIKYAASGSLPVGLGVLRAAACARLRLELRKLESQSCTCMFEVGSHTLVGRLSP